jgi:hypothetical protein
MNASKALATLTHAGTQVSLEFWFNSQDEVDAIYTPDRWGAFSHGYKQLPWLGRFFEYTSHGGVRVPSAAKVSWRADASWNAVWRGRIETATYDTRLDLTR